MRTSTLMMLLAAPLALAACDSAQETETMEDMPMDGMAMEGHDLSAMDAVDGAKTASAVGTVTAIDAEAGTITVDHEPVAELGWPQMVMAFDASEEVRGEMQTEPEQRQHQGESLGQQRPCRARLLASVQPRLRLPDPPPDCHPCRHAGDEEDNQQPRRGQ